MNNNPFQRFKQKESGARKKEKIRQEKKQARLETKEYFEQKKKAARQGSNTDAGSKQVNKSTTQGHDTGASSEQKKKPQKKGTNTESSSFQKDKFSVSLPNTRKFSEQKNTTVPKSDSTIYQPSKNRNRTLTKKPVQRTYPDPGKATSSDQTQITNPDNAEKANSNDMPLNKFVAHAGICSRRDAAELVKSGAVMVNGKQITEPGFKVTTKDEVKLNGKKITSQKNLVYILLNKPKDFITTTEDPQGRKTVMDIVKSATSERVYPVGRLDRNTTGVLLLTNDGELAQKLSHPSYQIKKIYEVKLDKPLQKKDFETIINGIELEDGFIAPDTLAYADSKDKSVIGIEIHSGRNRIVRRIFEKLGYDVRNLDRVMYANLTKKNVERGKWRFLQEKEIRLLKYLNASLKKANNRNQNA
jgi:23S rRNA pseudouridine2605 synthase